MVERLTADAATVRANLGAIGRAIAAACDRAGRDPSDVAVCAATKYVDADGMRALRDGGVRIAAENRLQDLVSKQEALRDDFEWHFIGRIQSRKIPEIARRVSVIHSLATDSAVERLRSATPMNEPAARPELLVQVNVSGESSKEGVAPTELERFIESCPWRPAGLMTMPPATRDAEAARPYFRELAGLAKEHELPRLSMGTSQDFVVAVEEGATLVRVGSILFAPPSPDAMDAASVANK